MRVENGARRSVADGALDKETPCHLTCLMQSLIRSLKTLTRALVPSLVKGGV